MYITCNQIMRFTCACQREDLTSTIFVLDWANPLVLKIRGFRDLGLWLSSHGLRFLPLSGLDLSKSGLDLSKSGLDLGKSRLDLSKSGLDLSKSRLDLGKSRLDLGKSRLDLGKSGLDLSKSRLDLSKSRLDLASKVRSSGFNRVPTPCTELVR